MGTMLAQVRQGAFSSGARCLPLLGRFAVRRLPNKWMLLYLYSGFLDSANAYYSCSMNYSQLTFLSSGISSHLTIPFISKPSRQLPDNRQTTNCLSIRILRQKNQMIWQFFWKFLFFTKNQRYGQLLLISSNLNPNRSLGVTWILVLVKCLLVG